MGSRRISMKLPLRKIATAAMLATALTEPASAAERKLLMAGFKNLVVEDDIEVTLTIGQSPKAQVNGDKAEISRVILERRGNTIVVKLRSTLNNASRRPATEPLRVTISNRDLENIELRGNGRIVATNLKNAGNARIFVFGSGDVTVNDVSALQLTASVIGNGSVTLGGGKVRNGQIELQGNAKIDAAAVTFNNVKITHQGNGTSSANVTDDATIFNSGRGKIIISGKGSCFVKQAGSATIDCPKYALN
jgi:Putative auto-transporter adhesin, head GIN domain